MKAKKKPDGASGTGPGCEFDHGHYPEETAARQRARLLGYLRRIVTAWDESTDATGRLHRVARYQWRGEVRP